MAHFGIRSVGERFPKILWALAVTQCLEFPVLASQNANTIVDVKTGGSLASVWPLLASKTRDDSEKKSDLHKAI